MRSLSPRPPHVFALALLVLTAPWILPNSANGQVCNVKVVTDANPDYYDLPSLVRSITGKWSTPEEQCWAMFYWNHIARRQTSPMILHGVELTDPIRQFNDYGYTMCSTIAGINCGIWHQMGLPVKFWDISLHTVSGGILRRTLAHVRQFHVGHLHVVRRRHDRGRRGHRPGRGLRGFGRQAGAGAYRQIPLLERNQPQRLPDGRGHAARLGPGIPLFQSLGPQASLVLSQLGLGPPLRAQSARRRVVHALLSQPGKRTQVLRAEPGQGPGSGQ